MAALPDQYFNAQSFLSVGGGAAFVYLVVNGIQYYFGRYKKYYVLIASAFVAVVGHFLSPNTMPLALALIIGNTFLVAATATGLNETSKKGIASPAPAQEHGAGGKRKWTISWL